MRLPRDLSGDELIRILQRFGYRPVRQTGSHVRLVCTVADHAHCITIPRHKSLRLGTLNGILQDVAGQLGLGKEEILQKAGGVGRCC